MKTCIHCKAVVAFCKVVRWHYSGEVGEVTILSCNHVFFKRIENIKRGLQRKCASFGEKMYFVHTVCVSKKKIICAITRRKEIDV